jgi:hypothetical protein
MSALPYSSFRVPSSVRNIVQGVAPYFLAGIALTIVTLAVFSLMQHYRWTFLTGYTLYGVILFLTSFHWRKKLACLRIGKVSGWMNVHLAVGFLSIGLFFMHVGAHLPLGIIETTLYLLFVIVAGSGVYGLCITRTIPRQLTALQEEVIYEEIPQKRREIASSARQLILNEQQAANALIEFYALRLAPFLEQPRSLWYYAYPTNIRRQLLLGELQELNRYLDNSGRNIATQIQQLIIRKDEVDCHAALQGRLKLWMFLHVGFTYSLILMGLLHGLLVHAFQGGN